MQIINVFVYQGYYNLIDTPRRNSLLYRPVLQFFT